MLPNPMQPATEVGPDHPTRVPAEPSHTAVQTLDLDEVYGSQFDFVWRSARRLGVPVAALDDAVQDVFLIVHRKLGEFEGRSSLRSWLFGITRRVVHDYRRSSRRRPAAPLEHEPHDTGARAPDEQMLLQQQARVLHELLETLDDDKREAFVLSELEQMSGAELADALQLNVNTAYARVRAARQAFEAALRRYEARTARLSHD